MVEKPQFYTQRITGIRYRIGDLYGYPDSLIRARTGAAYEYGLALIGCCSIDKVLDFGSGRGHGVKAIKSHLSPKTTIVSLDKHLPSLQTQKLGLPRANEYETCQFVNASTDLPFQDASFDAVFCMHVIEHLRDPAHLMDEIFRILHGNGRFILATPDKRNIVGRNPYDEHVFTQNELSSLLEKSGFAPDFFYIVPNKKALRVHERKKWLASHASFTGRIRNYINPQLWDKSVLRFGISREPLKIQDFTLLRDSHPNTIDILLIASKTT